MSCIATPPESVLEYPGEFYGFDLLDGIGLSDRNAIIIGQSGAFCCNMPKSPLGHMIV
jgi:hypothetical protein